MFDLAVAELESAYRSGALSPVEVARAVLERIAACEPQVQALYALDAEAALDQARASQARWRRGEPLSALDGVPVTIKENIATRGTPVPLGTAATLLTPAADDAPPAARLREAGAVLLAKTTMPDYGMLSSGLSSFHPLTRNPRNLALNPGGSSAGAGAAAAAGYGPLHLGTDIGGSIRLPAAWCGVAGFKPSGGRVPIHPPYAGRVAGPLARRVDDIARSMAVLSRPDARDATSLPPQDLDWLAPPAEPRGLRVGLLAEAGCGLPVDAEVAGAVRAAASAFAAAGAIVEPVAPFFTRAMLDGMDRFWRVRAWLDIEALPAERRARVLPFIVQWAEAARGVSAAQLFDGYSQMAAMRDAAVAACRPYDIVIMPTCPVATFPAEWAMPTRDPARAMEHIAFTLPFNMSEQPALSLDCGSTRDGRPIGLQIVGARHADVAVLRAGRLYEMLHGPIRGVATPC